MIEKSPESDAVEIGGNVQMSCFASGVPAPEIKFYHNDAEVVLDSRVSQIDVNQDGIVGSFLVVTNAMAEDDGTYYCEATNIVDTAKSSSAMLIVFSKYHNQLDE